MSRKRSLILSPGRWIGLVVACLTLTFGVMPQSSLAQGASGTDVPIIVMADDSDELSIPSNSSVSKYINTEIKEAFSRYHYYVVSQDAVAANQGFDFNRRMSSAKVLEAALMAKKSGQPEFDVRAVVIYKVYPQIKDAGFAKVMSLEISGEVHDADANRFIGKFGPMTRTFPAPADCNDSACISGVVRQKSVDVAAIVADEARKKLAMLTKVGGTGVPIGSAGAGSSSSGGLVSTYNIRFENFEMTDVLKIKGVMEGEFPDFVRAGKITGSEPIVEYGYVSKAPQNKIFEWVHILLRDMQVTDAKVLIDGSKITLKRLGSDLPPPPPQSAGGRFN